MPRCGGCGRAALDVLRSAAGEGLPMLGPPKARHVDRPVRVSLEDLVPAGHFYRHLEATLDLSFVRELVRDRYAPGGRPSLDPVVYFKLQLILFFEGLRSERKLVETASLNLAHRWYLGYALDESLPDASTLTKVRQRLGLAVFRRFFERVVELCQEAGLVWGRELYFDATRVRADAAVDSVVPRLGRVVGDHIEALFPEGGDASDEPAASAATAPPTTAVVPLPPRPVAPPPAAPRRAGRRRLVLEPRRWDLLERCRLDPGRPLASGYRRLSAERVSRTDPDATLMSTATGGPAVLGYQTHYVVDGGRDRIILHALTTPGDVMEGQTLQDLLWRVRFRWRLHPRRAVGDSKYGTVANILALEDAGIRAYFPLADTEHRESPYYPLAAFRYDADHDTYWCPQGHPLRRYRIAWAKEFVGYVADPAVCNVCPVRAACTPGKTGRHVHRSLHAAYLDRVRGYHTTEAYKRAMRKRAVWVEPLFGEAKEWHGLRRFRLRGLAKVNTESLLVAAGQNLKRWLAATGWGRRHAPCGALALPRRLGGASGGPGCWPTDRPPACPPPRRRHRAHQLGRLLRRSSAGWPLVF
jgi:transposase/IS5 family transposase